MNSPLEPILPLFRILTLTGGFPYHITAEGDLKPMGWGKYLRLGLGLFPYVVLTIFVMIANAAVSKSGQTINGGMTNLQMTSSAVVFNGFLFLFLAMAGVGAKIGPELQKLLTQVEQLSVIGAYFR